MRLWRSVLLVALVAGWPAGAQSQTIAQLRQAAEKGDPAAAFRLGVSYRDGAGVPQDFAQAFVWFRRAANQDHPDAQFLLGRAAEGQFGQPQDYAQAAQWYRRAAAQGIAPAMGSLGMLHISGAGVPVDIVEAHKWLNLGASRAVGELLPNLIEVRDKVAASMSPEQLADAQQRARPWMAAFEAVYPTAPGSQLPSAPPTAPPPMAPVRVGGEIQAPTKLKNVEPIYPAIAQSARV